MTRLSMGVLSFLILTVTVGLAGSASAAECEGVKMPASVEVEGTKLSLNGQGLREATILKVDVYVAGLYVENKSNDGQKLASADAKKRLVLSFVRDVDRSDVVDAYTESFKKAAGAKHAQLAPKLKKLNGWMSAMKEGGTQTYTYVPEKGLEVAVNGETKGTIEGADFAEAFFKIWLGSSPPNSGLKRGLLGGKCS